MIPNFFGALLGVLAGQALWHGFMAIQTRRNAKRVHQDTPVPASLTFGDPEQVWCRRCSHEQALRVPVGLHAGDEEGGPIGWFTACPCEDQLDVMRRHHQLVNLLEKTMDEFLMTYVKSHKKPQVADAVTALIEHMVTAAKENSA